MNDKQTVAKIREIAPEITFEHAMEIYGVIIVAEKLREDGQGYARGYNQAAQDIKDGIIHVGNIK